MKKLVLVATLVFLVATSAFAAEVGPHTMANKAAIDRVAEMAELHNWVSSFEGLNKLAPMRVQVPIEKLAALAADEPDGGPLWIGVQGDIDFSFDAGAKAQSVGSTIFSNGYLVWSGAFRSPGATGVRLFLEKLNMPEGGKLYVYGRHGRAFGPYTGLDFDDSFWTNTVASDEIVLQAHVPLLGFRTALMTGKELFRVSKISHLGERYNFGFNANKAFCSWNDSCITNAECESIPGNVQPLQDAVAYLLFDLPQGTFLCSGGLLNDTGSTGTPYLLTANHCFSTVSAANSLEAHFQWTVGCGASCGTQYFPPGSVPRTLGSTLLATSSSTDFTLVQLSQSPPSGSVFLGWTTAPVANSAGTDLYRVSHPSGSPQAYSEQSVNTTSGTCGGLPRGNFIYSDATLGDSEGGSSGSPVVNGSGQVVGQLFGACGATPETTCDNDDRTVDGAFAVTFSAVSQWLDPSGGPTCGVRGDRCTSNSDCCSNRCRGRRVRRCR